MGSNPGFSSYYVTLHKLLNLSVPVFSCIKWHNIVEDFCDNFNLLTNNLHKTVSGPKSSKCQLLELLLCTQSLTRN